ncbi:MAG TPA: Flp family type IVb pilin [Nocardioidaceae bacterium]|nr:Flp family type IVb pilin [Nocardioidaceae bacterium]
MRRPSLPRARTDHGASAVEYALIIALIAAVTIVAVIGFQRVVKDIFGNAACNSAAGYSCSTT